MKLEDALEGIRTARDWIEKEMNWQDGNQISVVQAKLASKNSFLADHIADLHFKASQSYIMNYKKFRASDEKVADAEVNAKEISNHIRKEYEECLHVYRSTQAIIDSLRSHLATLRNETQNTNLLEG